MSTAKEGGTHWIVFMKAEASLPPTVSEAV